ncbi:MAG: VacJ family lipoprotein [Dissulfurispiraceae bacterium]
MKGIHIIVVIVFLLSLAASAYSQTPFTGLLGDKAKEDGNAVGNETEAEQLSEGETLPDPLEPWNRFAFEVNDRLYFWFMKPAARGYNAVVPEAARTSVNNFFRNLEMPVRFVNAVLQGQPKAAGIELVRFTLNSSMGLGGLIDIMKRNPNFQPQEKDTGQTLGKCGIGNGVYIVWPFLGPSTIRDTVGLIGDGFLTPIDYITPFEDAFGAEAGDYFNKTSLHIGEYEDFKESAIDPYIALKDAYLQHRKYMLGR